MLKTKDLRDWLEAAVPGIPGSMDGLPEDPNLAFSVSISGGLGLELEDALDRPSFTILTRGQGGGVAEDYAYRLDEAWINADPDFQIGGYLVRGKGRTGGPPAYVATDDRRRVVRAATYWCRISRV